jgi:succinoglycan biosynthesis protein ExoM
MLTFSLFRQRPRHESQGDEGQPLTPVPRITVCALTCQRPEGLERLLGGLASQEFTERPPLVELLIIDNNPDASARSICELWRDRLGMALTYVHEPRPGIAVARNRALDSVDRDAEWIAFIDDDEVPASDWLECLLRGQRIFDADVVSGLVLPYFANPPPPWVQRGGFFDMIRRRTGSRLTQSQTNNVMFRAAIVRELELRFDERFARGSDTVFFRMIANAGYSIVRVNEALVEEWVAEERVSESWLTDRRYQSGVLHGTMYLRFMGQQRQRARFAAKLAHKVLLGAGLLSLEPILPYHIAVRARCRLAYSLGVMETLQPRAGGEPPEADGSGGSFGWARLRGSRRLQEAVRAAVWRNASETPPGGA